MRVCFLSPCGSAWVKCYVVFFGMFLTSLGKVNFVLYKIYDLNLITVTCPKVGEGLSAGCGMQGSESGWSSNVGACYLMRLSVSATVVDCGRWRSHTWWSVVAGSAGLCLDVRCVALRFAFGFGFGLLLLVSTKRNLSTTADLSTISSAYGTARPPALKNSNRTFRMALWLGLPRSPDLGRLPRSHHTNLQYETHHSNIPERHEPLSLVHPTSLCTPTRCTQKYHFLQLTTLLATKYQQCRLP